MARVSLSRCSRAVRSSAGVAPAAAGGRAAAAGAAGGCIASAAGVVSGGEVFFGGDRLDRAAAACEPALDRAGAAAASAAAGGTAGVGACGAEEGAGLVGADWGAGVVVASAADGRAAPRSCVHATRSRSIGSEAMQSRCTSNSRTVGVQPILPPLPERGLIAGALTSQFLAG